MTPRLFGREPALWIAVIQAVLILLFTMGVPGIDGDLAGGVSLVLTAAATTWSALAVRPVAPTVFTGLIIAVVQLLSRWGLHWDDTQIGALTTLAALTVTLIFRAQVTPVDDPRVIDGEFVEAGATPLRR